jgi:hypothetical protein
MPGKHREGEKLVGVWLTPEELALLDALRARRNLTRPRLLVELLLQEGQKADVETLAARVAELERRLPPTEE